MATQTLGSCCAQTNFHEGTPEGSVKKLFGLDTYQVGEANGNDRVIIILTDVYGYKYNNNQLIADQLAKNNYHVLVPDILNNDPFVDGGDIQAWFPNHLPPVTLPIVEKFVTAVKKELSPKFLGGIGHCFGAKYVAQHITANGVFDAGAFAHPSLLSEGDIKAIAKPLIISAAETDPIFTREFRHQTEGILADSGIRYELTVFGGVSHGFAVRGDISVQAVRYAKEKTLSDQLTFFSQF